MWIPCADNRTSHRLVDNSFVVEAISQYRWSPVIFKTANTAQHNTAQYTIEHNT